MDRMNLAGWRPIRVYHEAGQTLVDWMLLGDTALTEPFLQQSIQQALTLPFHRAFRRQTSIDDLLAWADQPSFTVSPTSFVFHVSRCGSTLVSQAFAEIPGVISLSEPPPLDVLLRSGAEDVAGDPTRHGRVVRAFVRAWTQRAQPEVVAPASHVIVKTDCWNILEAPLLRLAWPDAPWVFLYRNPVEVMVSQLRQPAAFMMRGVFGLNVLGLPMHELLAMPQIEFAARVLGRLYEGLVRHFDPGTTLLVNHSVLPQAMSTQIAPHLNFRLDAESVERMERRMGRHGKRPEQAYAPDAEAKQREASQELLRLVEQWVAPHYQRLEQLRAAQNPVAMNLAEEESCS